MNLQFNVVQDVDGDDVRCRWAVGSECGGVCEAFPAVLNMVCDKVPVQCSFRQEYNNNKEGGRVSHSSIVPCTAVVYGLKQGQ